MSEFEVLRLVARDGVEGGSLTISCLPGKDTWRGTAVLESSAELGDHTGAEIRLLEECDYSYVIELSDDRAAIDSVEPRELLSPNTIALTDGRIRAGRTTGTVRITVATRDGASYSCDVEVRSRKLDYESEYRQMMLRLAEEGSELLQSSFAAGNFGGFSPDQIHDSRTLYQRFAFLQAVLESGRFIEAMEIIRHRPHSAHVDHDVLVDPTRAVRPKRRLAQQLVSVGRRQPIHREVAGMNSLPYHVSESTTVETLDTVPNRFVRFALEHWKALATTVAEQLATELPRQSTPTSPAKRSAANERGLREAQRVEAELERYLRTPAITEAGRLEQFPTSNTVLHSKAGYRDVFRDFFLGEVATSLTWDGGEDVYGAGKRDVASLYEYWVFLELVSAIEAIDGFRFDKSPLVATTRDGMNLELARGRTIALSASGNRRGRTVDLELHFNPAFNRPSSWTVQMRPDCSLRIRTARNVPEADTWVHFDAKYRVAHFDLGSGLDNEDDQADGSITDPLRSEAQRADLQKMHAYRDAIRRTAGAYVLYPGGDDQSPEERRQYHEILPGLGAFALRPAADGKASAATASNLTAFLTDVIDHAASQGTSRERVRYWENEAYRAAPETEQRFDHFSVLDRPPADTPVLLGFVRGPEHLAWIRRARLYNLRGDQDRAGAVTLDSPLLSAEFVVLYDKDSADTVVYKTAGSLYVRSRADLEAAGYPVHAGSSRRDALYVCLQLEELLEVSISGDIVRGLAMSDGSPTLVTWHQIASAIDARQVSEL